MWKKIFEEDSEDAEGGAIPLSRCVGQLGKYSSTSVSSVVPSFMQ